MTKRDFLKYSVLAGSGLFFQSCSSILGTKTINHDNNDNNDNNDNTNLPKQQDTMISSNNNSNNNRYIKAKGLKKGDKVAVIAPSTNVSDPEDLQKVVRNLEHFGLVAVISSSLTKGQGYKTRPIEQRVEDLHKAFSDTEISGIIAVRGGYGSPQILDKIDYNLIQSNPKIFCGYSDITALHLAIFKKTGLITFHGPVGLSNFTPYTENSFYNLCFANEQTKATFPLKFQNPIGSKGLQPLYPTLTIKEGECEAELIGGNLSLITSLMGTEFEIDTKGKIFFLEDVGERPFRIDRMLTQLRLAGKFDDCVGIIIGKCEDCGPEGTGATTWDKTVNEVYFDILSDLNKPIIANMMIGHSADRLTLPLGIKTKLFVSSETQDSYISILESPTI